MGLSISGYVLEPPRVGGSNSAFTMTPNVYIANQSAFDAAYPSDESAPRTEYHVFVLNDFVTPGTGPGNTRSFVDADFAWTKNEVIQRFDYDGQGGRFKTLPGRVLEEAGDLSADANTDRLKVSIPLSTNTASYPIRLSLGSGSGTTMTVALVLNDGAFTTPAVGTVQLSQATGNLNWNPADLTTFSGQAVRFQRQTFYTSKDSSGSLGSIDDPLLLNPLPASGQFPLLRIGFAEYLTPVQRANEAAFSVNPTAGTVEWAVTTGRLKFNSTDITNAAGRNVYYDGAAFGFGLSLSPVAVGTVTAPATLSPVPPEASDTFFRIPGVVQFPQTQFVDTLTSPGKKGVVQIRRSDGQVRFSSADQTLYGAVAVQAVTADLALERGMVLRMFRTPVNPDDSDPTLKDVSAFYESEGAVLSDPIIGAPNVFLPAVPVDSKPITVTVSQGTGSFTGVLPRLDVASPPTGLGYIINFESRELFYAQRKALQVIPAPTPYGAVQLPDSLVFEPNLILELETTPNSGVYTTLTLGEDVLIDLLSGLVTLVGTDGELVVEGAGAAFSGTTFTDTTKNFTTAGVQIGDYLIVLDGAAKGVYRITAVGTTTVTTDVSGGTATGLSYEIRRGAEVLADRFFLDVPPVDPNTKVERVTSLGTISNSPRLTIDPAKIPVTKFRFGKVSFSTVVTSVPNDGSFTAPSLLPQGTVEVAEDTGHLNFSQADVTAAGTVYWVKTLTLGVDYTLQPPLGFVELTDRMLEKEEALVTYKNADGDLLQERASFLVRKELVNHPTPATVLSYNTVSPREPALAPSPRAFRGGRPQDSTQVSFDIPNSTVSFVGQQTVTDALPSGPVVDPSESVYVDYYVYEAVGGEQSFTVLQPPMLSVPVNIEEGSSTFEIPGDRTGIFAPSTLILLDNTESYMVASSSHASGVTTVTLLSPQVFQSDFQNPPIQVSSGPLPLTGSPASPAYFLTEMSSYDPVARGSSKVLILGDVSRNYEEGSVLYFSDGTFHDFYVATGAAFNEESGKTEITLTDKCIRQYSSATLKRSVRPVLSTPSASASTARSPELGQPYRVFRRVTGQPGVLLASPDDYTIDASGAVKLSAPLDPNEAVGIFYTGDLIVDAGRRFRASYTFGVVPTDSNGLIGQVLKMDYTTYIPDTFFWRVETFTNFRGELEAAYEEEAKASVPTGGPLLENSSSPRLFEQGKESVFFAEGYLANEDLVARPTLKYFNDSINSLEDALTLLDGRVVGDHDGKFLFDGLIDNPPRASWQDVTNQIDDRFKISPAPYTVTGPPFVTVSVGTYREVYKASATSRFYPTMRRRFGATVNPSGLQTGDAIMDMGQTDLSSVSGIQRRLPWAVVTVQANSGATTLTVDDADGSEALLRPAFANGMKVAIIAQDGTVLVPDSSSLTVSGVTATSLTVGALPSTIPVGATVRLATNDTVYNKQYRLGVDLGVDLEKGLLTYIDPAGSLLAWAGLTQTPSPPGAGEALDVVVTMPNTLTEPYRFPALDGGTTDDDGNRQFPLLTPSAASESSSAGFLEVEQTMISTSPVGSIRAATSPSFTSTGSLDGTGTIITNAGGPWPSPIPKIHDLVEIRSGLNAGSNFRRITAVGGSTVTVNAAFTVDAGFTFAVTTCNSLESGTTTAGSTSSVLNDTTANFSTVRPGHTVVMTSGANVGLRRQVEAVLSTTSLQVSAFPGTMLGATYRVDNPLQTFGAATSSLANEYYFVLTGESAALLNIAFKVDEFFTTAFTDMATGVNGVTSTSTFTSAGQTLLTDGVNTSHLLFIRNGANAGFYKIQSVDSETSLTIEGTFPSNLAGITFRIVSSLGLTADPLNGVLDVALNSEAFSPATFAYYVLFSSSVPVAGDSGAWAMRVITSDIDTREAAVTARLAQISTNVTNLEGELSAGDRLYDKRYTWIDARINLETGILVSKERAVAKRLKAQRDVLKQLTKLLSVRQA